MLLVLNSVVLSWTVNLAAAKRTRSEVRSRTSVSVSDVMAAKEMAATRTKTKEREWLNDLFWLFSLSCLIFCIFFKSQFYIEIICKLLVSLKGFTVKVYQIFLAECDCGLCRLTFFVNFYNTTAAQRSRSSNPRSQTSINMNDVLAAKELAAAKTKKSCECTQKVFS